MNGVLIVDKPSGCTSHDVVQRIRRVLDTRSVGHAGTLDPLATGVLVIAVGEGTKLASYLQAADKGYDVTIELGVATDTLDADGEVVERRDVPALTPAVVKDALRSFLGTHAQRVPRFSAVKVQGQPLHKRARAGQDVEPPEREVELLEANVLEAAGHTIRLSLRCSKGFFVRALARDLADSLGTVGHVVALRRTASGGFLIADAIPLERVTHETAEQRMIPLHEAVAGMSRAWVDAKGAEHAFHGRAVPSACVTKSQDVAGARRVALLDPSGALIAIAEPKDGVFKIVRGFRPASEP